MAQFLHPRSAKSRALLQLLSSKLKLQHRKVDIASFTLLNRAFQVTFFGGGGEEGREESMLKAAMANWQYLSGSQVEPPEFPAG